MSQLINKINQSITINQHQDNLHEKPKVKKNTDYSSSKNFHCEKIM